MSNELSVYAGMIFNKSGANVYSNESALVDIAGSNLVKDTQSIGTSIETLSFPSDVSGVGYLLIKNLDNSNYVTLGPTTSAMLVRINAGEIALFRIAGLPVYAQANTSTVKIQKTFVRG